MTAAVDETHDQRLKSWVTSANGHEDFPIQNLPIGVFSPAGGEPRPGVAIGRSILDLSDVSVTGLLTGEARRAADSAKGATLNDFLNLGAKPRKALRARLSELLREGCPDRAKLEAALHEGASCSMHVPAAIGDYTDFYVGIHHAENVGKQFRPDNPLLPNYKYVPIGYHGRGSSIRISGAPVRRPNGQIKVPQSEAPVLGPSQRLDYELELGVWVGGANELGRSIPISKAADYIAGLCILNDWSARDIQAWEYQPLGPFLSKNFGTTISPWIVSPEALAPFRIAQPPRPAGDPAPLPYLLDPADQKQGAFDIGLEVLILTAEMRRKAMSPYRLSASSTRHMYWTVAQMIAHHAVGGCNLASGDLLGTGTISAPGPAGYGSILEATQGGKTPLKLPSGEERRFLEDGDEIIMSARCRRNGYASIGFGECRATVLPAEKLL
jgi:fumarylacetoacetase